MSFPVISGRLWQDPVAVLCILATIQFFVASIKFVSFSQGSVATLFRGGDRIYNFLMWNFLRILYIRNY